MADKRILIVDDTRSVRTLVEMTLSRSGFEFVQASDGEDALAKATKQAFDLIITDLNMPLLDGIEFIRRLKQIPERATTPVFFLTTEASEDSIEMGKSIGVTAWIVKPFARDRLIAAVQQVLSK